MKDTQIRLNSRFRRIRESATLSINSQVKTLRRNGVQITHLGFGESPFPVPEIMKQALIAHAGEKSYLPEEGLPELREAVTRFLGSQWNLQFDPRGVFIGPGSKQLIFNLLMILDGTVIVPVPAWVSYEPQARLLGKQVLQIEASRSLGYRLDPDQLERACKSVPGQKILILNNPVNPTGVVYSAPELQALAEVCQQHDVVVIADEIYALLSFERSSFSSFAQYLPDRTIASTGVSKMFSAGGYRLGAVAIPTPLISLWNPFKVLISETYSSVAAPVQYAAVPAFEFGDEVRKHVRSSAEILKYVATYMWGRFVAAGIECPKPEGGFYLFPSFDVLADSLRHEGDDTSRSLARLLLARGDIATLPGEAFGLASDQLSLRVTCVDFDGAEALAKFQKQENRLSLFPNIVHGCDRIEDFVRTRSARVA